MAFTAKSDTKIMEILGVEELRHLIAETNKGSLTLMLRKGETEYHLVLDAVPLNKEDNKDLMQILFPAKEFQIPQVNRIVGMKEDLPYTEVKGQPDAVVTIPKKKAGRPRKSK